MTIVHIERGKEECGDGNDYLVFSTTDDRRFKMHHYQSCCESVSLEDIDGDLRDIIGSPILVAEESSNSDTEGEYSDSMTWTFYKLDTIKGGVSIRWYGTSNGCYSESADFDEINEKGELLWLLEHH